MDKHHILVVDDNHINRLFFQSSLNKLNSTVSLAEDGFQAIQLCRLNNFDLILMDIRMDGIDGIETASAIKALPSHQNTPILAVSAERFDCESHPEFATSLLKPITQDELKSVLACYLTGTAFEARCFDEQMALQISHQDHHIVQKLRQLLTKQLPDDWQNIKKLHDKEDWENLEAYLHKLLGSAKICAATLLIENIEQLKLCLETKQSDVDALTKLNHAIEATMRVSVKGAD
jgi:two-component system sensor histidine kinase BarA